MKIPYSQIKKGTFLIASPNITNGMFHRSVVLLCDHTSLGSFGLILNKPLETDLEHDLLSISELNHARIQVRSGGLNQPNQIILLQNNLKDQESSLEICHGVYLNGDIESLHIENDNNDQSSAILCFGHEGWNAGTLEKEFLSGAWFLYPASKVHVFETPPQLLWQTLLREMGGKYKTLSMMPEDLELN